MTSRPFILAAVGILAFAAACVAQAPQKPNIVVLLADDLGYGDLGCYGSPHSKTPHLDRLAAEGTRFQQFYAGGCLCSPSRAAMLTGRNPSRNRIYEHLAYLSSNTARGMPHWLEQTDCLLPQILHQAGYRTAMAGKWHLGGGSEDAAGGKFTNINHAAAPPPSAYGFDLVRTAFGNGPTWRRGEPREQRHDIYPYSDEVWTSRACELVVDEALGQLAKLSEQQPSQPWLMHLWFHEPHVPLNPPAELRSQFAGLPEKEQIHCAAISHLDREIGRFLARLDELRLASNTLVLFTSDNGAAKNRGGSNGRLREFKWSLYEGGIRVPLIVRWPVKTPANQVDATSAWFLCDWLPTLAAIAGQPLPDRCRPDGEDMSAALRGQPLRRKSPMFWEHRYGQPRLAMREGDWKLLVSGANSQEKLELYDLARDPEERTDVSGQHAEMVQRLRRTLAKWEATLPPPLPGAKPIANQTATPNSKDAPPQKSGVVMFGDSTTAERPGAVQKVYAQRIAESWQQKGEALRVQNAGVPSSTTTDARARLNKDVLSLKPRLVVLQFGINDAAVNVWQNPPATQPRISLAEFEANLRDD